MYLTPDTARQLFDSGFSYRHYQQRPHVGMAYYYRGAEWVIGGNAAITPDPSAMPILRDGLWLPSETHLMEWLADNEFTYAIVNTDGLPEVTCRDTVTGTEYRAKATLDVSLAAVIRKILKKRERPFDTKDKIYGVIEPSVGEE